MELLEDTKQEFKVDRSEWPPIKFGQVAIQKKENVDRDDTDLTLYVKGEHMESEDLHIRQWGELSDEYLGPAFIRKFSKGDILYGSRRTYLRKVAIAPFDGITSNTTFVINAKENLLQKNLLPFLMLSEGFAQHSIKNSKGSVNPYINWKDISNYEFLLPPKDQQGRLADLLWAADQVICSQTKLLEHLMITLESIRENIVSHKDHKRVPLSELSLGIMAGKSVNGNSVPARDGKKGVLKVSAVGANGFVPFENKTLVNQADFLKKFTVRNGDLLITRANTTELVGRVCLVCRDYEDLMLCDKTLRIDVDTHNISKLFLKEALLSSECRKQIEGFATGTGGAMKNITQPEILMIRVPCPSMTTQLQIEQQINCTLEAISGVSSLISISKQLQKSLINQIF